MRSTVAAPVLLPVLAGCALVAPVAWTVEGPLGEYRLICRGVDDTWCSVQQDIGVSLFRDQNPDVVVGSVEVSVSPADGTFVVRVCGTRPPDEAEHCEITTDNE